MGPEIVEIISVLRYSSVMGLCLLIWLPARLAQNHFDPGNNSRLNKHDLSTSSLNTSGGFGPGNKETTAANREITNKVDQHLYH